MIRDKKKYVREIWQYDLVQKNHTLLYLKNVALGDCILGAQTGSGNDKKCIYGKYTGITGDEVTVAISDRLVNGHVFSTESSFTVPSPETNKRMAITNDDMRNAFATDKELCTLDTGDESLDLDLEEILATNIIKRLYYIPKDSSDDGKIGEPNYASDYPHNICIPTQNALAAALTADGVLEEGTCNYYITQ